MNVVMLRDDRVCTDNSYKAHRRNKGPTQQSQEVKGWTLNGTSPPPHHQNVVVSLAKFADRIIPRSSHLRALFFSRRYA